MWGWVAAGVVTILWLQQREKTQNAEARAVELTRALAVAERRISHLSQEMATMQLSLSAYQSRVDELSRTLAAREQLLRELQAVPAGH